MFSNCRVDVDSHPTAHGVPLKRRQLLHPGEDDLPCACFLFHRGKTQGPEQTTESRNETNANTVAAAEGLQGLAARVDIHFMSFITQFFIKPAKPTLLRVPCGSFTVSRAGQVMTSTLPQAFATAHIRAISEHVLAAFRLAKAAEIPLTELVISYAALKLVARDLRGSVVVFIGT